jgi:hypothetical protein
MRDSSENRRRGRRRNRNRSVPLRSRFHASWWRQDAMGDSLDNSHKRLLYRCVHHHPWLPAYKVCHFFSEELTIFVRLGSLALR